MSLAELSQLGLVAADLATHLAFRVVPHWQPARDGCACRRSICKAVGNHPRLRGWVEAATTDYATIRRWWTKTPEASIGIATGSRSGVIVLDVDPRNGGLRSIEELEQEHFFLETLRNEGQWPTRLAVASAIASRTLKSGSARCVNHE